MPALRCLHLVPYFGASGQTSPRNFAKSQPEGGPSPLSPPPKKKEHTIRAFRDSRRTFSLPPPKKKTRSERNGLRRGGDMFRLDQRFPHPSPPSFPVSQGSAISTVACALFFFPQKRRTKSRTKALFFAATSFRSFPNSAIAETASGSADAACFRLSTDLPPHPRSRFFQLLSRKAAAPFGQIHPVSPLQNQARADAHAAFLTKQTAARLPPGDLPDL